MEAGQPPVISQLMPQFLVIGAFNLPGIIYDWKTKGRPHPTWLIGAAVLTVTLVLRAPLGDTALWQGLVDAPAHIAG